MKMTNEWNRIIYRLWAPIYDATVSRFFMPGRRRALEILDLRPGERVLLVGVGTGEDLRFLPSGVEAVGVDLSPDMLRKAEAKLSKYPAHVALIQGDAQLPLVDDCSFDAAILNLIVSVVPDGTACFRAALKAVKPEGRLVIFDKFLREGQSPSLMRRFMNLFSRVLGTDINRRLSDILQDFPCCVLRDEPSIAGGMYRVILLCKRLQA